METKIRQLRQEKGITQQALADSSGVTRQTINAYPFRDNDFLLIAAGEVADELRDGRSF